MISLLYHSAAKPARRLRSLGFVLLSFLAAHVWAGMTVILEVEPLLEGTTVTLDGKSAAIVKNSRGQLVLASTNDLDATLRDDRAGKRVVELDLPRRPETHVVSFARTGYETLTLKLGREHEDKTLPVALTELVEQTVTLETVPAGATLRFGQEKDISPAQRKLVFRRTRGAWQPVTVEVELKDFEADKFTLTSPEAKKVTLELKRLREEIDLPVRAYDENRRALPVTVALGSERKVIDKGLTPVVKLKLERKSSKEEWTRPVLQISDLYGSLYKETSVEVSRAAIEKGVLEVTLNPSENHLWATRWAPDVVSRGDAGKSDLSLDWDGRRTLAKKNPEELGNALEPPVHITQLKRIVSSGDKANAGEQVFLNSFAVFPNGRFLVLALTRVINGTPVSSSLFYQRNEPGAPRILLLANDGNAIDTAPTMAPDGENILVFQSNRLSRQRPDLFAVRIEERGDTLVPQGGLVTLTRGPWFSFAPATTADSNGTVYFLGANPEEPGLPWVKSVRIDGTAEAIHPSLRALTVNRVGSPSPAQDLLLLTQPALDKSGPRVIWADLTLNTTRPLAGVHPKANALWPATGYGARSDSLLFSSDQGDGEKNEAVTFAQNDVFVMKADGSELRRLTNNISDDIMPVWSPLASEAGKVFYLLSNRGDEGVYNVWRMTIK